MLKLKEVKIPKVDKKSEQITIEPEVIRFAGFEVGKLNIVKMNIINRGMMSQKIQIVPPRTNFFSVKFDQRGAIGPQQIIEVYITLKPFEYKYYEDTLKINTYNEIIVIPILAFPSINRDYLRDLFPRYLDFGTLDLGEQFSQRFIIQNKVPINFDFEFIIIKDNIDFRIIPIRGTIPERGVTEIEIMYRPSINVTVYMEVELTIGVDFEPLPIKLMGTGRSQDKNQSRIRRPASVRKLNAIVQTPKPQQKQQQVQKDLQSSQDNIDEYSIPEQSPQIIYESAGGNEEVEKFYPIIKTTRRKIAQLSEIVEIKQGVGASGRQAKEKQYLERFNLIANLDKEKENKLRQFIGDQPIEQQTIQEILYQREQFNQQMLLEIQQNGLTRYQLELDNDNAVADQILPKYECQWDFEKNDLQKIKKIF